MVHRPIGKHSLAINKLSRHGPEDPGIIRAGPMIAHNEIFAAGDADRSQVSQIRRFRRNVRLGYTLASRISTVSSGNPTTRLINDFERSKGYQKTTTSPRPIGSKR